MRGLFGRRRLRAAHENLLDAIRAAHGRPENMSVLEEELKRRLYDAVPEKSRDELYFALLDAGMSQMVVGMLPDSITEYLLEQHEGNLESLTERIAGYNVQSDDVDLVIGQYTNEQGESVTRICAVPVLVLLEAQAQLMSTVQSLMEDRRLTRASGEYGFGFRLEARVQRIPRGLGEILELLGDTAVVGMLGPDCGDPNCPIHGRDGLLSRGISILDPGTMLSRMPDAEDNRCGDPNCEVCYPHGRQDDGPEEEQGDDTPVDDGPHESEDATEVPEPEPATAADDNPGAMPN